MLTSLPKQDGRPSRQLAETPALASPLRASFQREPASDLFGEFGQVRGDVFLHRPGRLRTIGQPPDDPLLGLRAPHFAPQRNRIFYGLSPAGWSVHPLLKAFSRSSRNRRCHTHSPGRVMLGIIRWFRLLLLPKHLPVGLAIGIKAIMFTPFPSSFQFGPSNVPVRTAFLQHSTQVLPKLFDGRSAKKPVGVVDLEYSEARFKDDDMRNHRIVLRVRVLGDVEILLNLASRIG